jgi:hypothetical protein
MKTMALIAAMMLCACGEADEAGEADAADAGVAPALDTAMLAGRGLGASSLPAIQLVSTARGRAFLASVVSCALPRGAAITAITPAGTPYSFAGARGLAPGWAEHAPTSAERRQVAACVEDHGQAAAPAAPATPPAVAVRTLIRTRR